LQQHGAGNGVALGYRAVVIGQFQEEVPVLGFLHAQRRLRAMLSALREALDLSRIGQTSTHSVQPVQSSGATW
jgi:hypothetical protein